MTNLLIINEKPSQFQTFKKALGGEKGTYKGFKYTLCHSYGHLFELKEPAELVSAEKKARYSNWDDLSCYPWDYQDFKWEKILKMGENAADAAFYQKAFSAIKQKLPGHDAVVIATDTDPSGEGDLLAWEIIEAMGWQGKVFRLNFDDSIPSIQRSFDAMTNVSNKMQNGAYLESTGREQFELLTMQLSRIAKIIAYQSDYKPNTQRIGRLKSVIVDLIYQRTKARDEYVKKPYYELKYKDHSGNIFSRKFTDGVTFRHSNKTAAEQELNAYSTSPIVIDKKEIKKQEPSSLPDLGQVGILVGKHGFKDKEILATYQAMYDKRIVSYPRTETNKIDDDQFAELLPLIDKIAKVVGVDPSLLTHRNLRKKHKTAHAEHGANRPWYNVPESLNQIRKQFGECGVAIYSEVAKAFLAILCEDYVYEKQTAHLQDYPEFKSSINIPKELNYKLVFNEDQLEEKTETDEEPTSFSASASPYIFDGANTKPSKPNKAFILNFLKRKDIGTGATRLQTLADVSQGTDALVKVIKGTYTLTYNGQVQAILCKGTMIASPTITQKLQDGMKAVKNLKMDYRKLPTSVEKIVAHDLPIIKQNAANLRLDKRLAKMKAPKPKFKDKVRGNYLGKEISFNKTWGNHTFTDLEIQDLLANKEITFQAAGKDGNRYPVSGKLAQQTFKGKQYYGFQLNKEKLQQYLEEKKAKDPNRVFCTFEGQNISFKRIWGGHRFTDEEIQKLIQGEKISFSMTSKRGSTYMVTGKLAKQTYKRKHFYGFKKVNK